MGYLAWHSGLIRQSILPLFLISECAAVFLIGVWLYIKKKQKMVQEMRDTFLSAITHEMKTPTAVIKNSVECPEAGLQPEKQAHYLEMIGQESEHMNELMNSMLIYTRTTDASRDLQKEDCSLEEMAAPAASIVHCPEAYPSCADTASSTNCCRCRR